VSTQTSITRQTYNELLAVQPPPPYASSYDQLVTAANQCLSGQDSVEQAIGLDDTFNLQQGTNEITACLPGITNAGSQFSDGLTNGQGNADEANYRALTQQKVNTLTGSLNTLIVLLNAPQLGDGNWQAQVSTQTSIIRQTYDELIATQAPPSFAATHTLLVTATEQCLTGLYSVEQAVDFNDTINLQQGISQITPCLPNVMNAGSQLNGD
jgi:hypothetical protein